MQLSPKFCVEEYAHLRIRLFTFWGVYGLIPTVHWVWLHGGFDNGIVPILLPRIFVMYALCGLAFAFYLTKLPERYLPGLVDIIGHSHQIWHLLVFLALLFWHQTGVKFALFRVSTGCGEEPIDDDRVQVLRVWPF
jgi:predicted membrane channel-forming protein YqfA (hemolysin III family)